MTHVSLGDAHVLVDFNAAGRDGLIQASARYFTGPYPLDVGLGVLLEDPEGNRARGRVVSVSWPTFELCIDWSTWRDADDDVTKTLHYSSVNPSNQLVYAA